MQIFLKFSHRHCCSIRQVLPLPSADVATVAAEDGLALKTIMQTASGAKKYRIC